VVPGSATDASSVCYSEAFGLSDKTGAFVFILRVMLATCRRTFWSLSNCNCSILGRHKRLGVPRTRGGNLTTAHLVSSRVRDGFARKIVWTLDRPPKK
jgi:hypothetical protein